MDNRQEKKEMFVTLTISEQSQTHLLTSFSVQQWYEGHKQKDSTDFGYGYFSKEKDRFFQGGIQQHLPIHIGFNDGR